MLVYISTKAEGLLEGGRTLFTTQFLTACVLMLLSQASLAQSQKASAVVYEAAYQYKNNSIIQVYYDKGKYAIVSEDSIRLYDGKNPLLKWRVNKITRTARLDYYYPLRILISRLRDQGIEHVASTSDLDISLLKRLARVYKPYSPRNLDHLVPIAELSSANFLKTYRRIRSEKVAGWQCDVYSSRLEQGYTIWVEPVSNCVLKTLTVRIPDDARMPPESYGSQVSKFHPVSSLPPTRFMIPAGYTAVLPLVLRDLPLPPGVQRKLMTGKDSFIGVDLKYIVEDWETVPKRRAESSKRKAEWQKAHRR